MQRLLSVVHVDVPFIVTFVLPLPMMTEFFFSGIVFVNCVVEFALLGGSPERFGSESLRLVCFEDFTSRCQPMPKILKKGLVIQSRSDCIGEVVD